MSDPYVVAIHLDTARRMPTRSIDVVEAEAGTGPVGDPVSRTPV